jgi:hypothetical protein
LEKPKTQDPMEIFRESLANVPVRVEASPPVIGRAEVLPYPDLIRLWMRLETSEFAASPNLEIAVFDPADKIVSQMFLVEIPQPYQSLTLHLRETPQEGGSYRAEIKLVRDDAVLDTRSIPFDLVFRDPESDAAEKSGE